MKTVPPIRKAKRSFMFPFFPFFMKRIPWGGGDRIVTRLEARCNSPKKDTERRFG
jgi:hypothetical protein